MSSDSDPIPISSDTNMEDVSSDTNMNDALSHTVVVSSIGSTSDFPLIVTDTETEPFEEGEVAPTPPVSPTHGPIHPPSPLLSSSSSSYYLREPIPTLDLPLKKRARFDIPASSSTEPEPPARFEIGESSKAAAARQPSTETLGARIDSQQVQIDRMLGQLEELSLDRVENIEEEVEGLVIGRVSIDMAHQGLESRQLENRGHIVELRQEMPELYDRAEMAQDELQRHAQELALARESMVTAQTQISELRDLVASLTAQVRDLQDRAGGAPGGA